MRGQVLLFVSSLAALDVAARGYHEGANLNLNLAIQGQRGSLDAHHNRLTRRRRSLRSKCKSRKPHPNESSGAALAPSSTSPASSKSSSASSTKIALWDWADSQNVMHGVNLGSWLMLEKWMTKDLFASFAPNAVDDYTFSQTLGSKTASVLLNNHWNSFVQESDIDLLSKARVTHIRIPFGYWAFLENINGDPFPALSGQQAQLNRVIGYAAARKMHVILDIHSAPGRASIDQCNGRVNGPVQFYDDEYQTYNDQLVQAIYKFIAASPHRSNIAALALVNEPDACTSSYNETRINALQGYYQRSYDFMAKQSHRVPVIIHHGYCGLPKWQAFVQDKDPSYLVMEDHPYPGTFVSKDSPGIALQAVCDSASTYANYPVPVAVTEYTLGFDVSGAGDGFTQQMANQQISAWANSAGSTFWSHNFDQAPQGWSFAAVFAQGLIGRPAANQTTKAWATGLGNSCQLSKPSWA